MFSVEKRKAITPRVSSAQARSGAPTATRYNSAEEIRPKIKEVISHHIEQNTPRDDVLLGLQMFLAKHHPDLLAEEKVEVWYDEMKEEAEVGEYLMKAAAARERKNPLSILSAKHYAMAALASHLKEVVPPENLQRAIDSFESSMLQKYLNIMAPLSIAIFVGWTTAEMVSGSMGGPALPFASAATAGTMVALAEIPASIPIISSRALDQVSQVNDWPSDRLRKEFLRRSVCVHLPLRLALPVNYLNTGFPYQPPKTERRGWPSNNFAIGYYPVLTEPAKLQFPFGPWVVAKKVWQQTGQDQSLIDRALFEPGGLDELRAAFNSNREGNPGFDEMCHRAEEWTSVRNVLSSFTA